MRGKKLVICLNQSCPTFLLVRATFTGEKLSHATCIFAKSKLQIIARLLHKVGAHFGQYYGNLSQKEGEDQKKKKKGLRSRSVLISVSVTGICPKEGGDQKKKVLAANPNWCREYQNKRRFWFKPFYLPENTK